jgi:hypothetical protein
MGQAEGFPESLAGGAPAREPRFRNPTWGVPAALSPSRFACISPEFLRSLSRLVAFDTAR